MSSASADIEGRWPIPPDWNWRRAKDFAKVVGGGTPKNAKDPANYAEDGTPWITPADLSGYSQPTIGRGARSLSETGFGRSSAKLLPAGTVLVSSRAPVGYCAVASNDVSTNQGFRSLVLDGSVDPFFLRYYVLASRGYLEDNASGTTFKELPGKVLEQLLFPIPPIETQKHIVARIDELFTELDNGEAALERARDDLDIYRKSLLKAAVTGELTADWRAANPPQETGEQLLQRILAGHRSRWETRTRNNGKRYKEPRAVDQNNLPALPEAWTWLALDQLLDGIEAGKNVKALGRPPETGETGIVKVSSVTWWDFDENASKTLTSEADYSPSSLIQSGDMLVSRANTLELVGAPAIVRQLNRRLVLSDKVLRLLMPREFKAWVFYVLRSSFGRAQIEARSTGNQLSMRNISQDSLRSLAIPLPPLEELSVALKMAADCLSDGAELASGSDRYLGSASELRQSILASAFKGELVA